MLTFISVVFLNILLVSVQPGLSLSVVNIVQSNLYAQPKGKTVLYTDVGFLSGLPKLLGVDQITVEMCLQGL